MKAGYGGFIEAGFMDCLRDIRLEASRVPPDMSRLYSLFMLLKDLNAQLKILPEEKVFEAGRLYRAGEGGVVFVSGLLELFPAEVLKAGHAAAEKTELFRVFAVHFDPCAELLDVRAAYMAESLSKLTLGDVKYVKSDDYSYEFTLSKSIDSACFSDFPYVLETEGKNT